MKLLPISELFKINHGNSLELNALDECEASHPDKVNFVSRTRENNGVSATVIAIPDIRAFDPGLITVALSGTVLESFLQSERFYTGFHIDVLKPFRPMSDLEKLFYCYCITLNQYKYNFGRQANKTLKHILVPASIPKSLSGFDTENVVTIDPHSKIRTRLKIDPSNWKTFKYGGENGIFEIKGGYYNRKPDHTEYGNIPFVGASEFNNGITERYSLFDIENNHRDEGGVAHDISKKIFKANAVTVANNGASVGYAFYQEEDFTCSHDVNILYLRGRKWTRPIALFICSLIFLDRYRWAYGRKWRPVRMPNSEIKLPVDRRGNPDWDYMENFIGSLPLSSQL